MVSEKIMSNKNKKILVYSNGTPVSDETAELLMQKLTSSGYFPVTEFNGDEELIVCIGGDGGFLEAIHKFNFPHIPFIGINTGHLGFFQEIMPEQLDEFIFNYGQGKYILQPMSTVKGKILERNGKITKIKGLNDIVIRSADANTIHLNISIGGSFIERFSGDGIVVSTAAGSTAYNYSLGGAIVDPRLKMLQVTPIAPMNTTAYRAFTSSIMLPSKLPLTVVPDAELKLTKVAVDGRQTLLDDIERIDIGFSNTYVNLLRFESYDFWNKVKTKFL